MLARFLRFKLVESACKLFLPFDSWSFTNNQNFLNIRKLSNLVRQFTKFFLLSFISLCPETIMQRFSICSFTGSIWKLFISYEYSPPGLYFFYIKTNLTIRLSNFTKRIKNHLVYFKIHIRIKPIICIGWMLRKNNLQYEHSRFEVFYSSLFDFLPKNYFHWVTLEDGRRRDFNSFILWSLKFEQETLNATLWTMLLCRIAWKFDVKMFV